MTQPSGRGVALALIAPALAVVALFFVAPLAMSVVVAFRGKNGGFTLEHFAKAFDFYTTDLLFTLAIVVLSTVLIGVVAIAIAGYLTLGGHPRAVAVLRWLYRWPLFIPFVVAGQVMRTFLAKNGMLNHVLIGTGLIDPLSAQSLLDWRGIVIAFVWKQAPFVTLLLAGAMASLEPQHIEAARNLGARRLARAHRHRAAAGARDAAGRAGAVVRHHAVGAVRAADDQSELADHDHRRRRVPDQHARRLSGRQRAVPAHAGPVGDRGGVLSAPRFAYVDGDDLAMRGFTLPVPLAAVFRAAMLALIAFAIFGPLLNLMLWAFAERWYFPSKLPLEFGLTYWYRVFQPRGNALASLGTSVWIALLTVAFSLAVAIPAGYALARLKLPWRGGILLLFLLPQAVPNLPVYVNIAQVFYQIGLNGTILGVVLVHASHGLVLAVWIASAAFASVDVSLEEASRNLGASPWTCFRTVTLPLATPGLIASAIFVFLESLDEFTGTYFVGVPDVTTLPLLMFNATMGGNYQISSITALLLLHSVDRLHARRRALPQGGCAGDGRAVAVRLCAS